MCGGVFYVVYNVGGVVVYCVFVWVVCYELYCFFVEVVDCLVVDGDGCFGWCLVVDFVYGCCCVC